MPCGHDLVEHVALGEFWIDMRRVDIARHDGEELDVLIGQGPGNARRVSDPQLVERPIFDPSMTRPQPRM
jgi:hypothetical protein